MHPFTKWLQKRDSNGQARSEYHPHGGDAAVYFRNKHIKLDNQSKSAIEQRSAIFAGCVIYITGYTSPSHQELKTLVVANGGQICAFLGGKTYATHIVAASLTARKREQFANDTVVTPQWVVDSVQAQKRLDWTRYSVFHEHALGRFKTETETDEEAQQQQHVDQWDHLSVEPFVVDSKPAPAEQVDRRAQIEWILSQRARVDCTHPDFLKNYFKNSRLHFLSTHKQRRKRECHQHLANFAPGTAARQRLLMHVDFDSFFVAVALKRRPELADLPVCVANGSDGSDIASCNYVARARGVHNGMWLARARELCPDLMSLPYDFEEYERCSQQLYGVLLALNPVFIAAVSVDEAILDVSNTQVPVDELCSSVRAQIKQQTGIEASVGVGANVLLCKLALKLAKPAGQRRISDFREVWHLPVSDLPGVGSHIAAKLGAMGCRTIGDLQHVPLKTLQTEFGMAMGHKLYAYALGTDTISLEQLDVPVQSVGIDIGWGVRVINRAELDTFVLACVIELHERILLSDLHAAPCRSCQYTVKVHKRSAGAAFITSKYMGHGHCDVTSRSQTIPLKLRLEQLQQTTRELVREVLRASDCEPLDFRGLGLHIKARSSAGNQAGKDTKQQQLLGQPESNTLHNYFSLTSAEAAVKSPIASSSSKSSSRWSPVTTPTKRKMYPVPPRKNPKRMTLTQMLPPPPTPSIITATQIDMDVLAELPKHIQQEVLRDVQRSGGGTIKPRPRQSSAADENHTVEEPIYSNPSFVGLRGRELRRIMKEWIESTEFPKLEDIQLAYTYACDAVRSSRWCDALDLAAWIHHCCCPGGVWVSEDWRVFSESVDSRVQQLVTERTGQ